MADRWETWRADSKGNLFLYDKGVNSLGLVPVAVVYGKRCGVLESEPPLLDLAWLNVRHWQSSSDQTSILHTARVPVGHAYPWGGGPGRYHWRCRSVALPILKSDEGGRLDGTRSAVGGPVDANETFTEWFKRQSKAEQDELLGPRRGELYRKGGVSIERFADTRGELLTLAQLRARDAAAFTRAGL